MKIIEMLLSVLPFVIFCIIAILRPIWLSKWGFKKTDSEKKTKIINKIVQFFGTAGLLFIVCSLIYSIFFAK